MYSSASNRRRRTPEPVPVPRSRAPVGPGLAVRSPRPYRFLPVYIRRRHHLHLHLHLRLRHPGSSWASHLSTSGVQITIYDYRVIGPFGCSSNSDPLHRVSSMPCNLRGSTIESPFFYYHLLYSKYSLFDP